MTAYLTDDEDLNSTPRAALHHSRCGSFRSGIARVGYVPPATDTVIDAVIPPTEADPVTHYLVRPRFWDTETRPRILQTPPDEVLR